MARYPYGSLRSCDAFEVLFVAQRLSCMHHARAFSSISHKNCVDSSIAENKRDLA
jgi:hypothetical protein